MNKAIFASTATVYGSRLEMSHSRRRRKDKERESVSVVVPSFCMFLLSVKWRYRSNGVAFCIAVRSAVLVVEQDLSPSVPMRPDRAFGDSPISGFACSVGIGPLQSLNISADGGHGVELHSGCALKEKRSVHRLLDGFAGDDESVVRQE